MYLSNISLTKHSPCTIISTRLDCTLSQWQGYTVPRQLALELDTWAVPKRRVARWERSSHGKESDREKTFQNREVPEVQQALVAVMQLYERPCGTS